MKIIRGWASAPAAVARGSPSRRIGGSAWRRRVVMLLLAGAVLAGAASMGAALFASAALYHVYFDRQELPDLGPFTRFEFPTIGHVYDTNGQPLIELAREYRTITQYADIPPVLREAILATEDKRARACRARMTRQGLEFGISFLFLLARS